MFFLSMAVGFVELLPPPF